MAEREYWSGVMERETSETDSVAFLAVSLDAQGRPIPVVNTDPATGLFLGAGAGEDIEPFVRSYPVGLFVDGVGPLATNDAYASSAVWERFRRDPYHGPSVVWGREVNLLQLGLIRRVKQGNDARAEAALRRVVAAVRASGLEHNELWSYRIEEGRLLPTRYGTSSDIQLWTGTHLAVQYVLSRRAARLASELAMSSEAHHVIPSGARDLACARFEPSPGKIPRSARDDSGAPGLRLR